MGWHLITDKSSPQYALKQDADTTGRYSIAYPEYYAMMDGRMLIATKKNIGGIFEVSIGNYVDILFQADDGTKTTYKCNIGDEKFAGAESSPWGHYDGKGVVEIIYHNYNSPDGYNDIAPDKSGNPWDKGKVLRIIKVGNYYDK